MTGVELSYGKGSVRLPAAEELARPECFLAARAPEPREPASLFREAIAAADLALEEPVVVVLPDETRPIDRRAALDALAEPLAGRRVEVVVGAGLHPAATLPSPWPLRVHDARAPGLVPVGRHGAIEVRVDPAVAGARTLIVCGAVMPHYLAGFSGGPKGLVPGVAAEETILAVHALADRPRPGIVRDNPFAQALRGCAARITARTFFLHLLVGPRGPFDALVGTHEEAVKRYRAACAQPRPAPADVVVAGAGGHPVDATLLQAHKAYEAAAGLTRPGGMIVLVAACDAGFGHAVFERRLRDPAGPPHPYARTARAWHEKTRRFRTRLVTELDVTGLGVERVDAASALAGVPAGARLLWAERAQDLLFVDSGAFPE